MNAFSPHNGWVIIATFLAALILTLIPLPGWLELLRPEWVMIVLIYWCLAIPERVGVIVGWVAGITLDVATGSLLGQHALELALVAFIVVKLHKRIRLFPVWQQAVTVLLMALLSQLITVWVNGVIDRPTGGFTGWLPSMTTLLLWPPLFMLLRRIRRFYRVR